MSNSITVINLENNTRWQKDLNDDDFQIVKGHVDKGAVKDSLLYTVLSGTWKPIRTNNLTNFAKDFFLPTTVNQALRIQNTIGKVIAAVVALFVDLLTLPIRVIMAIPRVIMNSKKEESPLYKYLLAEGVDSQLLASDYVQVGLTKQTGSTLAWKEFHVNFIELPAQDGSHNFRQGSGSY